VPEPSEAPVSPPDRVGADEAAQVVKAVRRFRGVAHITRDGVLYSAAEGGIIELPASEHWYHELVEAGVLLEVPASPDPVGARGQEVSDET
jgi:hypothetical protein